ncbi:hypothetical protein C8R45DRAFT_1207678 [Mycena sanguinolenta]|nr:hypothetical protein C8R45DRAFT_1207678 [Mycena sanguinolenta]
MAISALAFADFVDALPQDDTPDRVRARLEWSWGLGHGQLDEHLLGFDDPQSMLTDETVLLFPHNDMIRQLCSRDNTTTTGVRRSHISKLYDGLKSFEYLCLPIAADSALESRILTSELPPHLAVCTTYGKLLRAWGKLQGDVWEANLGSVVERAKAGPTHARPALGQWQLTQMGHLHTAWTWSNYVPLAFLSASLDEKTSEGVHHPSLKKKRTSNVFETRRNSFDFPDEPKRRLLPSELESPPLFVVQLLAEDQDDEDEDDSISHDSYISGVEGDPEEFAKASMARGDHDMDAKWLTGIRRWAKRASSADGDETLLNDKQIPDDPREQPRDAASLDLGRPDYLLRSTSRTAI